MFLQKLEKIADFRHNASIMTKFLHLIFGDPTKKVLAELSELAAGVNALEDSIISLSDAELKAKTLEFQERLKNGQTLDDIAPEAFAVVREAAKRTLKQRHFDVQLMGGFVLHQGKIAEMRTGEGKTLTSTLAIYLNALEGKGVHVVTVNDYLAKRDAVWMGQVYHFLGLSVGCIQQENGYLYDEEFKAEPAEDEERDETGSFKVQMDFLRPANRKAAYDADITYGTNNQFGFDYLRDNMATQADQMVQRELNFAIVDEIDSILIDEARTPLIISAPAEESADLYYKFAAIVKDLKENVDYNIDEKMRVATFSDEGINKIEKKLGVDNLYTSGGLQLVHHAEQALKAEAVFHKDKDYVVQDGEVKIVDEFTGRIMEGRRYSEGTHQAIEAKEGVEIKRESRTLATITFQNYFRMYKKLSGMTGTAATEAEEFMKIYDLDVVEIPTNKPIARVDLPDRIYKNERGKWLSIVDEVKALQEKGQPVLIGTVSIEKNEFLSELLTAAGVKHEVLNAKNHEGEAQIVAQAGRSGSVTVATNMAGRGVDIVLGGNPTTKESQEAVKNFGGLHVIGTDRHESRRIDNQLRGRSGRQGDPGSTQFYVSTEDDLMRIFGSERVQKMMETLKLDEKTPIESKMITNALEKAQQRVEGRNFDTRKHVLEYDDVLNKHRTAIYDRRRAILLNDQFNAQEEITSMVEAEVERVILFHTSDDHQEVPNEFKEKKEKTDWDPKEIVETLRTIMPISSELEQIVRETFTTVSKDKERLAIQRTTVIEAFMAVFKDRLAQLNEAFEDKERLRKLERIILLRTIDNAWISHLDTMTYLRRSIGLQGYGQRDPLVEYKREAYDLFNLLQLNIEKEVVYNVMKILEQSAAAQQAIAMAPSIIERAKLHYSGAKKTMDKAEAVAEAKEAGKSRQAAATLIKNATFDNVGRNDLCPCGSGKKFKKCHGA